MTVIYEFFCFDTDMGTCHICDDKLIFSYVSGPQSKLEFDFMAPDFARQALNSIMDHSDLGCKVIWLDEYGNVDRALDANGREMYLTT